MDHRLATIEGRAVYALRKSTVEPVFGIIKSVLGSRQFHLRGLESVSGEWALVTMAWNLKRLFNLKSATDKHAAAARAKTPDTRRKPAIRSSSRGIPAIQIPQIGTHRQRYTLWRSLPRLMFNFFGFETQKAALSPTGC
jgi:hypothetical protein